MLTRRKFATLLTGALAIPSRASGQTPSSGYKTALYSGVGPQITCYEVDVVTATLLKRESVNLPANVQYAWAHPSKRFLYVSCSNGGPLKRGDTHNLVAYRMGGSSGALLPHGEPIPLRSRPIHDSVDIAGEYLLVAYNEPSGLSVHRIETDGTIGAEVRQPENLECGIYAHQILATPSNQSVILVTRGNDATATSPEQPGSLKIYDFRRGALTNWASVQPGNGLGFGPRNIDFHPTQPWIYVSLERENKLFVYGLQPDGGISPTPLFVKDTVAAGSSRVSIASPIHIHPKGGFVYLTNRGAWSDPSNPGDKCVYTSTHSNVAAFAIEKSTGEPTLIQTIDSHGAHPRTFSIDANGRILVAASIGPIALRDEGPRQAHSPPSVGRHARGTGTDDHSREIQQLCQP